MSGEAGSTVFGWADRARRNVSSQVLELFFKMMLRVMIVQIPTHTSVGIW